MKKIIYFILIFLLCIVLPAQNLVQVSGVLKDIENQVIPFARVTIPNTNKGTVANGQGFFSIVVKEGESIQGECIGFKPKNIVIPFSSVKNNKYYTDIQLNDDTVMLQKVIIRGFTEKDLKEMFINTQVPDDLQSIALNNMTPEELAKNNGVSTASGSGSHMQNVNKQVQQNYYAGGQTGGINLLGLAIALPRLINYMKQQKIESDLRRGQKYIR